MYGAVQADVDPKVGILFGNGSDFSPKVSVGDLSWKATASSCILQLLLWVSAWGMVDCSVCAAAPGQPWMRLTLYFFIAVAGGLMVPPTLRAQHQREIAAASVHGSSPAVGPMLAGFPVAVALASGLWGVIDSAVEMFSGSETGPQFKAYLVIVVASGLGTALHHKLWPHQVIDNLGQVSLV